VDFYCHQANLAIELDGSQHYSEESMEYDRVRTATLEECGIAVLRFTNRDIDDNFEGVCQVIEHKVEERGNGPFCSIATQIP
jgi:very-short-patch-repair endonuclease